MPSSLPRIAAYIDAELEQQLKVFCEEQGFSTSEATAYILKHFFERLPSEPLVTPLSTSCLDDLTKRLEAVEQAISELQSESLSKLPKKSCELPVIIPHPFPEEGLSTVKLADLTGVTVQQVNRTRCQGNLDNWKGGWRAVKINEKEHRYYPLETAPRNREV